MEATTSINYEQAKEAFLKDGFFIAKGVVPVDCINRCAEEIMSVFADQLNFIGISVPGDTFERAKALYDADMSRYKKVLGSLWRLASVGDLFCQQAIRVFLKSVIGYGKIYVPGGQVVLIQSEDLKIPGGYFGFEPHQDWPSVQGSLDGVMAWIPLCRIDEFSYPLEIVLGSHKSGLRASSNSDAQGQWTVDANPGERYVPITAEPGDVVFMSNFTLHRSGLQGKSSFMRIACSARFDNGDERSFIERAYPTAYIRSVHRQLMDFSGVEEVNQLIHSMESHYEKS